MVCGSEMVVGLIRIVVLSILLKIATQLQTVSGVWKVRSCFSKMLP